LSLLVSHGTKGISEHIRQKTTTAAKFSVLAKKNQIAKSPAWFCNSRKPPPPPPSDKKIAKFYFSRQGDQNPLVATMK